MESELSDLLIEADKRFSPIVNEKLDSKAQMLSDLGYIKTEFLIKPFFQTRVNEAFQSFYKDFVQSDFYHDSDIKKMRAVYQEQFGTKLLEAAIDIDEGFKIKKIPSFGEQNLTTRIIHYRLSLLGLYSGPVDLYFNAQSISGLEKAANYIQKTKLATINLLADFQAFTEAFLNENGNTNSVVVFRAEESINQKKFPEYSGKFKRQLRRDLKDHKNEFHILDKNLFYFKDEKVNENFLVARESDEINTFILRLIQVHQWMSGHYNGSIDSKYGDLTLDSLKEIIDNYNESNAKDIKPEAVFARVEGNFYIFNCLFFLKIYKEENYYPDKTIETLNVLADSYQSAGDEDKKSFENSFQLRIEYERTQQNKIPEKKNGVIRRLFFGIKTFFKKAFRFAKKLFQWIIKGIGSFIQNTIRMIYNFLKEAIRHFIYGVKFLLGKLPTVTTNADGRVIYSNFDLDKDGINVFGTTQPLDIQTHIKSVQNKVQDMNFSLTVVSFLLQLLKSAISGIALIGWPYFALKLVNAFKKVIDSYKIILTH